MNGIYIASGNDLFAIQKSWLQITVGGSENHLRHLASGGME
jgi:hypothetical protein